MSSALPEPRQLSVSVSLPHHEHLTLSPDSLQSTTQEVASVTPSPLVAPTMAVQYGHACRGTTTPQQRRSSDMDSRNLHVGT